MTGKGHTWTGIALSLSGFYFTYNHLGTESIGLSLLSMFFIIIGATAPDWMEIRKANGGTVIKHRWITHWAVLWVAAFIGSYYLFQNPTVLIKGYSINIPDFISISLLAFSAGGLLHLLVDLPNPMGVPIITPNMRFSLHLWKSGKQEYLLVTLVMLFSFFYIGIDSGVVSINLNFLQKYI